MPKSHRHACKSCGSAICACIPVDDEQEPRPAQAEKMIVIEVRGGCVVDVRNLPEGYSYHLIDHDVP
jgi:hypothetical protein